MGQLARASALTAIGVRLQAGAAGESDDLDRVIYTEQRLVVSVSGERLLCSVPRAWRLRRVQLDAGAHRGAAGDRRAARLAGATSSRSGTCRSDASSARGGPG